MIRLFSQKVALRFLAISIVLVVGLLVVARFHTTAAPNSAGAAGASSAAVVPLPGVFYTVTGTADNTDAVIHGGTGTAGDPFQMSSLRGAILNGNTVINSAVGPVTILVPAGTYLLSANNPLTPAVTGTIDFPDLEIGSTFNQNTTIIGTGGVPKIQQTVADNDVITTGFQGDGFTPVAVTLRLENLEITGGGFSGIFTGVDNDSGRSNTTIVNCNVHDNSNPFGQGGGIFNQTGDLTIQSCTFANNSASQQGGAIFFDLPNSNGSPGTFGSLIITDSTFNNNTASATNNVAGGAIAIFAPNRVENTYSITGSTFTNNHASGTGSKGGAIGSGGPGTLSVNLSRFVGNTAVGGGTGVAGQGTAPVNAINNWWGCDNFPGSSGCDTVNGSGVTSNPRLDLVLTSVPGCNSTTLTADFSKNSANQSVAPTVLNGLTVQFAVVTGPAGSNVSPPSATISGFMAMSNLTATTGGTATVSAALDNGTQTASADIDKAVAITSNPTNQAVCDGGTATFTAAASGNPTPTVQWQVSTNGGGLFTDIPGATNPILSFTATAAQNGNQYRAVFTNICESTTNTATTTAATLTVNTAPSVSTNPTSQTACDGATASFTAAANGSPAPTVQWQVSTNGGGTFSNIPGATSTTLNFTAATSQSGNQYRAVFTNSCGTATTTAATLTVQPDATTSDPADQTVCQGTNANFSTTAGGTGPFHYAWTVDGSPFNGDNSSISVPTGSLSVGNHTVAVTTTGACGSASQSATLTVQENTATSDPPDQTVCQGATANFSTTASGTGPFHYAWTVDGSASGGDSSSISVATGSLSVGNHTVAVTTTGTCGSASQSATLTVQENTATSDPSDQTVCQGATANFSTTASGTGPFHYAWTVDGSASGGDSSSISVATGSLSVSNHTVAVTTTGACGSASQSATLTVQANTTTTDPADQTVCPGTNANFSTTAGGTGPFHYAWTLDGSPFNGDSSSISVPTGSLSSGAHAVAVTTTGTCGSASQSATLTVRQNTATTDPPDRTACAGSTTIFSTMASGTGPFTFVWKKGATVLHNGDFGGRVTIANASNSSSLTIANVQVGDAGSYSVETTGSCNTAIQSASLSVDATPPTISCQADIVADFNPAVNGAVVTYTPPVGTDSCPGATTTQIAGLASGSTFPLGTTTNTFRVTDSTGQTAECSFKVTVAVTSIIGLDSVSITGSGLVDSYDSTGGYPATKGSLANVLSNGTITIGGSGKVFGNVRSTRAGVAMSGASQVTGNATAGTTVSLSGSATVGGTITNNQLAPVMTLPSVPACGPPYSPNSGISGTYSYAPGTGDLSLSGVNIATLANGNYCFHNVTLSNSAQLKVNGLVVIRMTGTLNTIGATSFTNTTGIPGNLRILSSYSGSNGVTFGNSTNVHLVIYAPNTGVSISGSAPLFGAVAGKTLTISNSGMIHYDTRLKTIWRDVWTLIFGP